eukprot:TRINITY_DN19255_c0_g1_i2.p6 TRINITY_DN19255_c0_g1~~TRINITY_DN19255_c0_g1_i2.p6  ORF type:complete len:103 (+),score=22.35 TRINITY_DN19255_c0_g1_i2:131-439(+)
MQLRLVLGSRWDLSAQPLFCDLLLQHNVHVVFARILQRPDLHTGRLLEVTLGVLANMMVVPAVCDQLCIPAVLDPILDLAHSSDVHAPLGRGSSHLVNHLVR